MPHLKSERSAAPDVSWLCLFVRLARFSFLVSVKGISRYQIALRQVWKTWLGWKAGNSL